MVVVDTSVWIGMYRRRSADIARTMSRLASRNEAAVCGHVWVEFLGGFRSDAKRKHYATLLGSYQWLETVREAYELAADWCATYSRLGAGDAIIAATAMQNRATLLTMDKDFAILAKEGLDVELAS